MTEFKIIAYGLETRAWVHRNGQYGCAECCNGDRCDEDCTAKYKGRRKDCPHCKGKGWIPETDVTQLIGNADDKQIVYLISKVPLIIKP